MGTVKIKLWMYESRCTRHTTDAEILDLLKWVTLIGVVITTYLLFRESYFFADDSSRLVQLAVDPLLVRNVFHQHFRQTSSCDSFDRSFEPEQVSARIHLRAIP
jgi:hypothetical protein